MQENKIDMNDIIKRQEGQFKGSQAKAKRK